ncbi:DUF6221 family protein [Micromonospora parva]|uniref:DUF6221 family protein n=1 Tax=Micromonospora parva TaxID=1464048 RepID=UPI0033C5C865
MSDVDDLVTWLRAQLDEEERVALAVPEAARRWTLDGGTIHHGHPTDEVVDWVYLEGGWEHIARQDPARVLAEVDAKRRILDLFEYEQADVSLPWGPPTTVPGTRPATASPVLRLLALPYADRPGYRDEWRP